MHPPAPEPSKGAVCLVNIICLNPLAFSTVRRVLTRVLAKGRISRHFYSHIEENFGVGEAVRKIAPPRADAYLMF